MKNTAYSGYARAIHFLYLILDSVFLIISGVAFSVDGKSNSEIPKI